MVWWFELGAVVHSLFTGVYVYVCVEESVVIWGSHGGLLFVVLLLVL